MPAIDWYALVAPTDYGLPAWPRLLAHQPPDATATIIHTLSDTQLTGDG